MSRPLERNCGFIICPVCGHIAVLQRYREDEFGIPCRLRMCSNGHLFATYQIMKLEKLQGDIVPFKEIIRNAKTKGNRPH